MRYTSRGLLFWHGGRSFSFPKLATIFGQIGVSTTSRASLVKEQPNWVSTRVSFKDDSGRSLSVYLSRLSPAVVVEEEGRTLSLFAGTPRSRLPGFCAFEVDGKFESGELKGSVSVPPEARWILLWYGRSTPMLGQGDIALLIVPHKPAGRLSAGKPKGVTVEFTDEGVRASLMQLFGIRRLPVSETARWLEDGVPESVIRECRWWAERLAYFPIDLSESYEWDDKGRVVRISYRFKYVRMGQSGVRCAPLPPMLAQAIEEGFGVEGSPVELQFSAPVHFTGTGTIFGPYAVVDRTTRYSWTVSGLWRYAGEMRRTGVPVRNAQPFEERLTREIQKILGAGILAPWIFQDECFGGGCLRTVYWDNPGENLYFLAEMAELLRDKTAEKLKAFIAEYQEELPPEEVPRIPPDVGSRREFYYITPEFLKRR